MTIVVAYADTPPGHAAVTAAVAESSRARETVIIVPAVRGRHGPRRGGGGDPLAGHRRPRRGRAR